MRALFKNKWAIRILSAVLVSVLAGVILYYLHTNKKTNDVESIIELQIKKAEDLLYRNELYEAYKIYKELLEKISEKDNPGIYSHIKLKQLNYNLEFILDSEKALKKAISVNDEALRIKTIEKYPLDYAVIQHNLGIAYKKLSQIKDKEENIDKAIQAYNEALNIYTIEKHPTDYSRVKNDLGVVYINKSNIRDKEKYLDKAIQAYNEALKTEYKCYYEIQKSLGTAYLHLSEIRDKKENLEKSAHAFHEGINTSRSWNCIHK